MMVEEASDEILGRGLSLIDHGIQNLSDLKFSSDLFHINFHCNEITKIENFYNLINLRFLDISSNKITIIEGLESLVNLQVLNLSCNQIQAVTGLKSLRKLEKLNLSYNIINDLTGLKDIKRSTHVLKWIELHGNKINSLKHLTECIVNCGTLEVLSLAQNGDSNPVCDVPAYRPTIFAQLPKLQILDGKDKYGHTSTAENIELFHPGLNKYLEWLVESNQSESCSTSEKSETQINLKTPKIDEALQRFKSKEEVKMTKGLRDQADMHEVELSDKDHLTDRLGMLEKQIETLLKLQMKTQMIPEKETTTTTSPESYQERKKISKLPRKKIDEKNRKERAGFQIQPDSRSTISVKGWKIPKSSSSDELQKAAKKIRDPKDDEAALMMMKELDEERERRWKAEQATRKLVNTMKEMQEKLEEERRVSESAISASAKLKAAFANVKEEKLQMEKSLDEQKEKFDELMEEVKNLRQYEVDARKIIGSLEETSRLSERERLKVQALKDKQLQEAQFKAAASQRENDLLKENEKNLKIKINQLQELLANREHDHKSTLDGMVKIDGKEVRDLIEKEMAKQEGKYSQLIQTFNERIESKNRDYGLLEDEFRAGLQMEANRFAELQDAYVQVNDEASELRKAFQLLKQKESKATSLVTELTSMVKEQKGRLEEINKSKQEMQIGFKDRISALDSQLETFRKQVSKMEAFKQERDKLLAQLKAHESVIEGLRTERKLWGQELAQQGASLAHDRGRLESQIESLTKEVKNLRQREQENLDGLKIKTKLIEDQTDTIKKLKQEIVDKKAELKKIIDKTATETKSLEKELDDERQHCQELQGAVDALKDRKDELKSQLATSESELKVTKDDLRNLKKKWEERSQMIGQLEERVVKMKENFDVKEEKLKNERDKALKSVNEIREKLKNCDDSFRRQLEEEQREHDLKIRQIIAQKDDEINQSKMKVTEVEEEMRILLEETAQSKSNFEQKFRHLSKAFDDIQKGLSS